MDHFNPGPDSPDSNPINQRPSKVTTNNSKPILILLSLQGPHIQVRFKRLLSRLQRDAELLYATSLYSLDKLLRKHRPSVAGIIITDARIMDEDNEVLSHCINSLTRVPARHPCAVPVPVYDPLPLTLTTTGTTNMDTDPTGHGYMTSHPNAHNHTYGHGNQDKNKKDPPHKPGLESIPLIFALDFPAQAARHPLIFSRYMRRIFGLSWRITGKTLNKVKLGLRQRTLRKMAPDRRYRTLFETQAVFLRGVKMADKVLVATGEFAPGGQPEGEEVCGRGYTGGWGGATTESSSCLSTDDGGDHGHAHEDGDDHDGEREDDGDGDGGVEWKASNPIPIPIETAANRDRRERTLDWIRGQSSQDISPPSPPRSSSPFRSVLLSLSLSAEEISISVKGPFIHENENENEDEINNDNDNEDEDENWADDELDLTLEPLQLIHSTQPVHPSQPSDGTGLPRPRNPNWVPSDDEGTIADMQVADSPVAIHETKTWVTINRGERPVLVRGYVGFVGHVTDSRSMGSLILGMCGVGSFVGTC